MAGMAIGLSLAGYKPLVYFERFDFVINALDAIVNHLVHFKAVSNGQFAPTVLFRVVVGNCNVPLLTGPTHTGNYIEALQNMVNFPVLDMPYAENVSVYWEQALRDLGKQSCMLVEYKDLYGK